MTLPRPGLLAIGALLFLATCVAADPCALLPTFGNAYVGDPKKLVDCFTNVPFQASQAASTVTALKSLIDLYSFTDMSANSGMPYDLKVDLRRLVADIDGKVKANAYQNDYAFQTDVMNAFNPLFDAHTLYRAPAGYSCFMLRPFNIEASVSGSNMQYTLRPGPFADTTSQIWKQIFNVDIKPYENSVVTAINGMSPTDHVMQVAQNFISTYKDQGVRYNAALRGRWAQTILSMFPVTDSKLDFQMTLTLQDGRTVTLPNAGFCGGGGITSTDGLLGKNKGDGELLTRLQAMSPEQVLKEAVDAKIMLQGMDIYQEERALFEDAVRSSNIQIIPSVPSVSLRRGAEGFQPGLEVAAHDYRFAKRALGREFHTTEGINIPVSKLPANFDSSNLHIMKASKSMDTVFMKYNDSVHPDTYILRLTTFAPADQAETLDVIQAVIRAGQQNNVKHLIMDVAHNGGGIICLSDLLLALLVPDWVSLKPGVSPAVPYGIYDFRQSASTDAIRANSALNSIFTKYTGYLDLNTEKVYTNASFYNPIQRTRGGYTSPYTQQAYFPAECIGYPGGSFQAISYYFPKIDVVTDGTCGSACALFASQLQSYNYARVISYGGPLGRQVPLSTASFAGGNVLEYGTVALYAYYYGNGQKGLPPMMASSALARFNFNEYYEYNELSVPREFLKRPADIHLDFYATLYNDDLTTALGLANTAALYSTVIAL